MTNAAAVAASVMTRTTTWVVSAGLSVHVNCVHPHQINQNRTRERSTPSRVRFCAVSAVTWVTANTNTRSKKSSTNVTPCSSGACSREWACAVIVRTVAGAIERQPGSNVSKTSWLEPPLVWRTSTGPTPRA